jgi:hypothetical protein
MRQTASTLAKTLVRHGFRSLGTGWFKRGDINVQFSFTSKNHVSIDDSHSTPVECHVSEFYEVNGALNLPDRFRRPYQVLHHV